MYSLALQGRRSWSLEVRGILDKCDLSHLFERDQWHRVSVYDLTTRVRQSLIRCEKQLRTSNATTMSRLILYNQLEDLNTNNTTKDYINCLNRQKRSAIAKLRTGTLPLMIEKGRYINKPRDERLCINCTNNVVENEPHFVFHCPKYEDLRDYIFYDSGRTDIENFKVIFSEKQKTKQLAEFIIEAFKRRI